MDNLADFRRQYPQYDDMSDIELAEAIHRKFYSDLPKEDVFKRLDVKPVAPVPTAKPAPTTRATAPLKETKPAGIFDYFTNRQAAIKQDREYRAYLQDKMQRAELEDIETQTGFFDRLGDLFSRGLLSARSGIKDVEAAIETDPTLKKQFTQEARRFAADKGVEITGTTTEQDVKDNFLRNAIPYIIEKGAESLPQMFAATNPLGVLGVSLPSNLGMQAREAAELQGRQDVSGTDVAKVAPGALAVTALDTLGLGGILAAPAKTALGRIGKAALLEGGTEAIQSAIEYANPRVVTGSDVDAGELFEQAAFGALAGGGVGGGLRGVGEAVAAPFRKKGEAAPADTEQQTAEIDNEFMRLVTAEAQTLRDADPAMTQRQAVSAALKNTDTLMQTAVDNILGAPEGEVDVIPDADTGMDVTMGGGAGAAPNIGPTPPTISTPELGEAVAGGLERPVSGVPVPDVGAGAGVAPLIAPTAAQVKATVPIIEQTFDAAAIDFEDAYGVKQLNAEQKKQAARIVIQSPEVAPYDAINSVLERGQRLRGETVPSTSRTTVTGPANAQEIQDKLTADLADIQTQAAPVRGDSIFSLGTLEAERRGYPDTVVNDLAVVSLRSMFAEGARGVTDTLFPPLPDDKVLSKYGPEALAAFKEGQQWGKDLAAKTQAAPEAITPPAPSIMPEVDLDALARSEAEAKGFDPDTFLAGATDVRAGREPLGLMKFAEEFGFTPRGTKLPFSIERRPVNDAYDAYTAGAQFAQAGPEVAASEVAAPVTIDTLTTPAPTQEAAAPETAPDAPPQRTAIVIHGGSDFEDIDPSKFGTGEPGNIRPLGNGLYGYVIDSTNTDEIAQAVDFARRYAEKYGRGEKAIHAFQLDVEGAQTGFNGAIIESLQGKVSPELQRYHDAARERDALPVGSPERKAAQAKFMAAYEDLKKIPEDMRFERLPVGLTEVGVTDTGRLKRIGKISLEQSDQDLVQIIQDTLTSPTPKGPKEVSQAEPNTLRSRLLSGVSDAFRNVDVVIQYAIYRMQDAWSSLTGKPLQAEAKLTDLLRDPEIIKKMNPAQRELAAALADVIDDDVNVQIGNNNFSLQKAFTLGVATFYEGEAPDVRLRGVSTAANIVTLLHEAVHIALIAKFGIGFVRLKDLGPNPDPEMVALRNEVVKLVDAYNAMVDGADYSAFDVPPYGMTNLDEFIAEGLTQPKFQQFLAKGNLWTRFVGLVRKLLGFKPKFQPQLNTVLETGAKLIAGSKNLNRMNYVEDALEQRKKPKGPKKPKVISQGKEIKLTPAQTKMVLDKAKAARNKMNRIQKRIASTNRTDEVVSGQIELGKLVRGDKENWALLRGAVDTLDVGRWKVILPALSTEDIFRTLDGRIEGIVEADRVVRQDVNKFQTKEYLQLADELDQIAAFLKKHPKAAQALSDLQFATVAYQVDPTKAKDAEAYAKLDKKTAELRNKLTTEKDPKKRESIGRQITRRLGEIESVYKGVPSGDERVYGWRDLGRPELGGNKGREIFKMIRDAHRRDLMASYEGLRLRLMETKKDEALEDALDKLEEQFKPAMDQVIYFPAMRFGSYYARVGKGANSVFKMFETETKRNQFVRVMEERGEDVTETGNVEDLRNQFETVTGSPLKDVLDLFDDNPKDIGALKGQVFDLWLQSLSTGDMRKHMAPRKMRAGYSTDILKNFANFRRSSINNQKRSKFGYKLRTEISRAKDSLEGAPDREKLSTFIKEIELRTLADLMPPNGENSVWEQAVQFGNKMAFYQYLANPKTAIIQLTQLHIVALPMLAQRYGSAKATAALAKYGFSGLGGFVVSPLTSVKKEDGSWTFNWEQPDLLNNPISALKEESDPELYEVLSEGWQEGRDLNLYMDTFANDIGNYGMLDPDQRTALQELMSGRPVTAALRGAVFTFEAMGSLMHQMERINREATYMSALELAYRENRKKGQNHVEAKKNAIEAATDVTMEATFDFSTYNKPRILTTLPGRVAGQFMTYPYMMSSLLVRNMYTAIKFGGLEPGERRAAALTATGALVNMGMYAGLTGLPLYGLFKVIGSMLAWLFDDEDEEGGLSYIDENGNIKATYNIDWWVRNVWIPKTFGPDGTVANLFGLDDETAAIVARSVEKGPISAITDIDLANSVALDFMFFLPQESRAETPEGKVMEATFNTVTGAMGGTLMDYIKAGKDLMNGYTDRALEKLPKLYGNMAKANRFAEEGQTNYARELVGMDKEFWTSDKAILQGLGFASTEASQRQQQNYEGKSITVKVEKARAGMLEKFRKAALDAYQYGYTPEVVAQRQEVMDEWVKFNQTYPTHVIGIDTLLEVQINAVEKAMKSRATRGVPMDEEGKTPYLQDILRERMLTEGQ